MGATSNRWPASRAICCKHHKGTTIASEWKRGFTPSLCWQGSCSLFQSEAYDRHPIGKGYTYPLPTSHGSHLYMQVKGNQEEWDPSLQHPPIHSTSAPTSWDILSHNVMTRVPSGPTEDLKDQCDLFPGHDLLAPVILINDHFALIKSDKSE